MEDNRIKIVVVDDHAIVRRGITALLSDELDFFIVAQAEDGVQALSVIEQHKPHILVTDLYMPRMGGLELLKALKEKKHPVRSIVLSMCADAGYVQKAFEYGAYGYVLKEAGVEHLVTAIRSALANRVYVSPPHEI